MKFTAEFKKLIKDNLSKLDNSGKLDYLKKLICKNYFNQYDLSLILDIPLEDAIKIFQKLDIKICANKSCLNPSGRIQSRKNFFKRTKECDNLETYCKSCHKEKDKLRRLHNSKKNSNNEITHKICKSIKCPHNGEKQPIKNFHKNKTRNDGFSNICKDCAKRISADHKKSGALFDTHSNKLSAYEKIRKNPKNPKFIQVKCFETSCQKWFTPTNNQIENRIKAIEGTGPGGENHFYCSNICKQICPIFNQKYSLKNNKFSKKLNREVQSELSKLVFKRDNYTCRKCNNIDNLECHHIEGIQWEPLESADIDMCITVCEDCHKKIHQIPGCNYHELKCS